MKDKVEWEGGDRNEYWENETTPNDTLIALNIKLKGRRGGLN